MRFKQMKLCDTVLNWVYHKATYNNLVQVYHYYIKLDAIK